MVYPRLKFEFYRAITNSAREEQSLVESSSSASATRKYVRPKPPRLYVDTTARVVVVLLYTEGAFTSRTYRRHAFSIIRMDTKKTYIMHAKSADDKRIWLYAIEQVTSPQH